MNKSPLKLFITYSLFIITSVAFAQNNVNSPYSRYGIGDLQFSGYSRNLGMGGLGIGVASPFHLNTINPASYAALTLTTFEGAVRGNITNLKSSDLTVESNSASFGYFGFGFPVNKGKWGLAFGLSPFSNVGYNISSTEENADIGTISGSYKGKGGVNKFFIGTGFNVAKHLRIGANASYLFGTINQTRTLDFDNSNFFNTRITDETSVGDFYFDFGIQYSIDSLKISPSDSIVMIRNRIAALERQIVEKQELISQYQKSLAGGGNSLELGTGIRMYTDSIAAFNKEIEEQEALKKTVVKKKAKGDWVLNFGATLALSSDINATQSSLTETYVTSDFGFVSVKDTVQQIDGREGVIKLPLSMGFGVTMRKGTRWIFGADVTAQDWTDYRAFDASDSLVNSLRFAAGVQYTPNERSLRSYWEVVQYRLGFHYNQTYLHLRNTDLNDYGVSIGFGLPMKRTFSTIQFSFEAGRMGTMQSQLVEINYFRFTLGLTLNDVWFIKPRID